MYVNCPEKPSTASKTYYVEEFFSCLKYTFQKVRQNSPFKSIDESMIQGQKFYQTISANKICQDRNKSLDAL